MITTKEKAQEIIFGFDTVIYTDQDHDAQVLKCALKLADEVLNVLKYVHNSTVSDSDDIILENEIKFWEDVKSELNIGVVKKLLK